MKPTHSLVVTFTSVMLLVGCRQDVSKILLEAETITDCLKIEPKDTHALIYGMWKEEPHDFTSLEKDLSYLDVVVEFTFIWDDSERLFGLPLYDMIQVQNLVIIRKAHGYTVESMVEGKQNSDTNVYCVHNGFMKELRTEFGTLGKGDRAKLGRTNRDSNPHRIDFLWEVDHERHSVIESAKPLSLVRTFPRGEASDLLEESMWKNIDCISEGRTSTFKGISISECLARGEVSVDLSGYWMEVRNHRGWVDCLCKLQHIRQDGGFVVAEPVLFLPEWGINRRVVSLFCLEGNQLIPLSDYIVSNHIPLSCDGLSSSHNWSSLKVDSSSGNLMATMRYLPQSYDELASNYEMHFFEPLPYESSEWERLERADLDVEGLLDGVSDNLEKDCGWIHRWISEFYQCGDG